MHQAPAQVGTNRAGIRELSGCLRAGSSHVWPRRYLAQVWGHFSRPGLALSQASAGTEIRGLSTGPRVVHRSVDLAGARRAGRRTWFPAAPGAGVPPRIGSFGRGPGRDTGVGVSQLQARVVVPGRDDVGGRGLPVVVTGDGELIDELVSLAGVGGVEVTVAVDALAAEEHWASAPLVVVGADQVPALARRRLPRRLGVVLVARASAPDAGSRAAVGVSAMSADMSMDGSTAPDDQMTAWSGAEALHAEHVVVLPDAGSWLVTRFAECRPRALRHAAPVVAFVAGSPGVEAAPLAMAVALTARRHGLATLLVGADPFNAVPDGSRADGGAAESQAPDGGAAAGGASAAPGTLAVLSFGRGDGSAVPPDAMAAALRAARHGRDLVVVDLPHAYDDAARLALTCADRCYLVVAAEVRACAAATRIAAAVRRHCPRLALVVRAVRRPGLRPDEVAEALDLPLAGVLPPDPALTWGTPAGPSSGDAARVVAALCRRLLAQIGASRRPGNHPSAAPDAPSGASAVVDR